MVPSKGDSEEMSLLSDNSVDSRLIRVFTLNKTNLHHNKERTAIVLCKRIVHVSSFQPHLYCLQLYWEIKCHITCNKNPFTNRAR